MQTEHATPRAVGAVGEVPAVATPVATSPPQHPHRWQSFGLSEELLLRGYSCPVETATKAMLPKFTPEQRRACTGPVVVASEPFVLEHPEHAHHALPAGTYQVTYQWDEAAMARVAD